MSETHVKPSNNMVLAILSTIFCCLPMGVVAIIQAAKVNNLYNAGDYEGATEAAENAKKYAMYSIGLGLVALVLRLVLVMAE